MSNQIISFLPALLKGSLECALTDCRWKKCSQHNSKLQIPNFKGKIFHPPSLDLRNFFSQQNGRGAVGPKRLDQQVRHARDSGTICKPPEILLVTLVFSVSTPQTW